MKEKLERQWNALGCASPLRVACWLEMSEHLLLVRSQDYKRRKG